jgi:hypothetical protein
MWRKGEKRRVEKGQGRAHSAMLVAGRKERAEGGKERKRKRRVGHVGRALRFEQGKNEETTKERTTAVQPPKPKCAALGNIHGKTARSRLDSNRRSVTSQARFSCQSHRPLLPISQSRGPGRIPRSLKTSTLLSSPRSAVPVSMPWAGGASIGSTDPPRLLLRVGSPTPPALAT